MRAGMASHSLPAYCLPVFGGANWDGGLNEICILTSSPTTQMLRAPELKDTIGNISLL